MVNPARRLPLDLPAPRADELRGRVVELRALAERGAVAPEKWSVMALEIAASFDQMAESLERIQEGADWYVRFRSLPEDEQQALTKRARRLLPDLTPWEAMRHLELLHALEAHMTPDELAALASGEDLQGPTCTLDEWLRDGD